MCTVTSHEDFIGQTEAYRQYYKCQQQSSPNEMGL